MSSMNIKKGDQVVVLAGKDRKKTGKVIEARPSDNKVKVEGVNIVSRHRKARKQGEQSSIVKEPAFMDVSNVQIVCPECDKHVRVRHGEADGKKVRVCAKCGASLDAKKIKEKKTEKKTKAGKEKAEEVKEAAEAAETKKKAPAKTAAKPAAEGETKAKKSPAKPAAEKAEGEVKAKKPAAKTAEEKTETEAAPVKKPRAKKETPAPDTAE